VILIINKAPHMTQQLMLLMTLGLAYSSYSGGIAAQKFHFPDPDAAPTVAELSQGPFISSPELHNPNDPSTDASAGLPSSAPIVVLPVPLPGGGAPGSNNTYGLQYPGSYMPRDTPLHRFNGYIVCNPPKPVAGGTTGATSESTGIPIAQRMVKITTTRSLAAPAYSQPCPIYTLDGEIQKNGSTTRSSR
jgi:hypothetical protein